MTGTVRKYVAMYRCSYPWLRDDIDQTVALARAQAKRQGSDAEDTIIEEIKRLMREMKKHPKLLPSGRIAKHDDLQYWVDLENVEKDRRIEQVASRNRKLTIGQRRRMLRNGMITAAVRAGFTMRSVGQVFGLNAKRISTIVESFDQNLYQVPE